MTPVRVATIRVPPDGGAELTRTDRGARAAPHSPGFAPDGAPWVHFGDERAYIGTQQQWVGLSASARRAGLALRERPGEVDRERLHVIIQKGRLFQREHPDVPLLVDKGRYLLVEMDPQLARRLAKRKQPCFSVRTLDALERADEAGENRVVFTARDQAAARAAARAADPVVKAIVDRISRTTFEADLKDLVKLTTRFSTSANYRKACNLVAGKLRALGYATSSQTISVNGSSSQNVVARRNGTGASASRRAVLVTAHLDSVNHEGTATSPAPGADDDGSGSAGVIEIARALKDHAGLHDLVFVLFGGEEQGLFGSKHFVGSLSPAQRKKVRAVVNMDMIGTLNTPVPTVLLEGRRLSQPMLDGLSSAASTYTALAVETSVNAANSDHVTFLDKGIPAVLTIEGADSTNDEVHTARDTLDRINFDLALEILRMNTAFVAQTLGNT
jgi:Peptidase family M28